MLEIDSANIRIKTLRNNPVVNRMRDGYYMELDDLSLQFADDSDFVELVRNAANQLTAPNQETVCEELMDALGWERKEDS